MYDPFDMTEETENANEKESKPPIIDSGERKIYAEEKVKMVRYLLIAKYALLIITIILYFFAVYTLYRKVRVVIDKDSNKVSINLIQSESNLQKNLNNYLGMHSDDYIADEKIDVIVSINRHLDTNKNNDFDELNGGSFLTLIIGYLGIAAVVFIAPLTVITLLKNILYAPYYTKTLLKDCYKYYISNNRKILGSRWIINTICTPFLFILPTLGIMTFFNFTFPIQRFCLSKSDLEILQYSNGIIPSNQLKYAAIAIILSFVCNALYYVINRIYGYLTDVEEEKF